MTNSEHHSPEVFMQRALELARLGAGSVSPNPMVGCVIVNHGKIIGEGWHRKFGEAHAEVNAVNDVKDKTLLVGSTVYVTLEPCSHFGKTPPCADLLVKEQVKRVVICNVDTNPLVGGKGIARLREAGIDVQIGVLENEGRELNKRFFTFIEKRRPYIILKWAQTNDGFIARNNFDSKWISGELSRQLVHKWRTEEDAILVGAATAKHDNPQLNVREWTGRNPIRIVIDKHLTLDKSLTVFDGLQKTFCYNLLQDRDDENLVFKKLNDNDFIQHILDDLHKQKIGSLIVEGGAKTLQTFIDLELWDEARIFVSPATFGDGISSPILKNSVVENTFMIEKDKVTVHKNIKSKF